MPTLTSRKMFTLVMWVFVWAGLLASCSQDPKPDDCGYTWDDDKLPKADTVHVEVISSWASPNIRERCRQQFDNYNTHGCYDWEVVAGGKVIGFIYLHEKAQIRGGVCDSRVHEFQHAAGRTHREGHRYIPGVRQN